MITFEVIDMTCAHCVGAITKAVKATDQNAEVRIDQSRHLVEIEPGSSDAEALGNAITEAGYTPVAVSASAPTVGPTAPRSGCCRR